MEIILNIFVNKQNHHVTRVIRIYSAITSRDLCAGKFSVFGLRISVINFHFTERQISPLDTGE